MKVLFAIVLIALVALCQAFLLNKNECTVNTDCRDTQCCVSDFHGHFCAYYQNITDPCHRPGHHAYVYKCGCGPGLMCEHIHLDHGTAPPSADPITSIEGAIENAGLGFCASSSTPPPHV